MKSICISGILCVISMSLLAQDAGKSIQKGNQAYRDAAYQKAELAYRNALVRAPENRTAAFNLGNTLFRDGRPDEAISMYERVHRSIDTGSAAAAAWYNTGVVFGQQKKLENAIEAYKQALRINPGDTMARQNLIRALREKNSSQKKDANQKQKETPSNKPSSPKLSKQEVAQLLKALQEQEKRLQQKMQQSKVPAPGQQEKDW